MNLLLADAHSAAVSFTRKENPFEIARFEISARVDSHESMIG